MICKGCKKDEELRLGYCWDCACAGEARAAKCTIIGHLAKAIRNIVKGSPNWRIDISWAWQRLTGTGDYKDGGYFDSQGIDWR